MSFEVSILMIPKDLWILDYVLDNWVSPDDLDPIAYVNRAISNLLLRPLTRHFEYAAYPHSPSQLQHLQCNSSTTGSRKEGNARGEGLKKGAGAAGGLAITGASLTPPQERPELPGDTVGGTGGQDRQRTWNAIVEHCRAPKSSG
jgi:hypothetical protein